MMRTSASLRLMRTPPELADLGLGRFSRLGGHDGLVAGLAGLAKCCFPALFFHPGPGNCRIRCRIRSPEGLGWW